MNVTLFSIAVVSFCISQIFGTGTVSPSRDIKSELRRQLKESGIQFLRRAKDNPARLELEDANEKQLSYALRHVKRHAKPGTVVGDMVLIRPEKTVEESYAYETKFQQQSSAVWNGQYYSGRVCSRPGCSMCAAISSQLSRAREVKTLVNKTRSKTIPAIWRPVDAAQQPLSKEQASEMFAALKLTHKDVYCDIGCGDGRWLIRAVNEFGCRAVGVEIDANQVERARAAVRVAGLPDNITIVHADAAEFDPRKHGITKASAFLWPETLEQLSATIEKIPLVVSFHRIPRKTHDEQSGQWYVYGDGGHAAKPSVVQTETPVEYCFN